MVGLRVSAAMLRKIDKFADALSANRTNTLRFLLAAGIEAKFYFLRRGRGTRMVDRVVRVAVADAKAKAAERAAERATDTDKVAAEMKALRAREHADTLINTERDRLALARALQGPGAAPKPLKRARVSTDVR
jgi:hypothetical protein